MGIKLNNIENDLKSYIDGRSFQQGLTGKAGGISDQGGFLYVVPAATTVGDGRSWEEPLNDLDEAITNMKAWDTIFCAPGNHTGNHVTALDAVAPFCSVIGMRPTSLGLAAWMGATDQALPIFQVKARGWRISGFEFDNPTTSNTVSAGIQLWTQGDGVQRADFCEIDHCLFTGGKAGIRYRRASTYIHIHDCHFDYMSGTTVAQDGAIVSADSGHALGGRWLIENNVFAEVVNQINIAGGTRGLNSSVIKGNVFQVDAQATTGVVLIDIRGGGAGNLIIKNYFGCNESQYGSGSFIRTNANDEGMGNWALDGPCQNEIEH